MSKPKITLNPQPKFVNQTACASGSFNTSARLDVQAAVIRNRTWVVGPVSQDGGSDYAAAPDASPDTTPSGGSPLGEE